MSRNRIEVMKTATCSNCTKQWEKRADSFKNWSGLCKSCSMKKASVIPHVLEAKRKNGIEVMKRVGKLPIPKKENRRRGSNHYNWRGGITKENMQIRQSEEMKQWRLAVFTRDNFTCTLCGCGRSGLLEADHIQPFSLFPELRFEVSNGRTLCQRCHELYGCMVRCGKIIRHPIMSIK